MNMRFCVISVLSLSIGLGVGDGVYKLCSGNIIAGAISFGLTAAAFCILTKIE